MLRFAVFFFCVSLIGALPTPKNGTKVFFNKSINPRIINGNRASQGQFPYQVGLYLGSNREEWFCGGSLISPDWILTAGHCVDGATEGAVITGSIDIYDGLQSDLSEAILHEDYDGVYLENDIGLLKTSRPLTLNANTQVVSLASQTLGDGVEVRVSGWGLVSDNSNDISEYLNYVDLVTITNRACSQVYGQLGDEIVCTTSGTSQVKGTCSGDSGGPVTANTGSGVEQVALVSFGTDEGCEVDAPSGYTRVAYFRNWIRDNTGV